MPPPDPRNGVLYHDAEKATTGYTLFTPLGLYQTYLIDMKGEVVHSWDLPNDVGNYAYLLKNGNLLAAIRTEEGPQGLPAKGGRLLEIDWDGNIVWEFTDHAQHHDFRRRPDGNTVYVGWELLDKETQSKVPGGIQGQEHPDGIYGDYIREIDKEGNTVWEWHATTDMDMSRFPLSPTVGRMEYAHANTIFPCENGDFIINWRYNNTMLRVDRDTKKVSWFLNEPTYGQHHDVQQLENGNILFFANGADVNIHGPETGSAVVEVDPATNEEVWRYEGSPRRSFMSWFISGCQRLSSGNTLICEGLWGRLFEVTPNGEIVWDYTSPYFVDYDHPAYKDSNVIFRCYRYTPTSSEIGGRLPTDLS